MAEKTGNVERTAGTEVIRVEGDVHIDATNISRSIFVTGFQATTKPDKLIIHFQRKKNGGGDITSITVSKRGTAVITFENPEGKMFMGDWLPRYKGETDFQPRV